VVGGARLPGSTLEYLVTVQNIAAVPAFNVVSPTTSMPSVPGPARLRARVGEH